MFERTTSASARYKVDGNLIKVPIEWKDNVAEDVKKRNGRIRVQTKPKR